MNKTFVALGLLMAALPAAEPVAAERLVKPVAGDWERAAGEEPHSAPARPLTEKAQVTGVRFFSSQGHTRIILDLSQEAKFEVRQLKQDAVRGTPPRVYIDIASASLELPSQEPLPVENGLLRQIRIGQHSPDIVRVVLDLHRLREPRAFIVPDPYRLVIDVQEPKAAEPKPAGQGPIKGSSAARSAPEKTAGPMEALAPGIRKIVLDPGHGGKDPGAIGVGGVTEKDIVLSVAKKLAVRLRDEMGIQVVLTRQDDRFVALEDRTAIANAEDADLFISLHMNASPSGEKRGIETYYLDNTTDEAALRLAARENGTSRKQVSDLQFILSDMTQNMKLEDSITLAHRLQSAMVSGMTGAIGEVKDLGVKKALFYVLVGARMPSVLVEMSFITHRHEGRAMSQASGQDAMVEALMQGIQKYAQSTMMARTL